MCGATSQEMDLKNVSVNTAFNTDIFDGRIHTEYGFVSIELNTSRLSLSSCSLHTEQPLGWEPKTDDRWNGFGIRLTFRKNILPFESGASSMFHQLECMLDLGAIVLFLLTDIT